MLFKYERRRTAAEEEEEEMKKLKKEERRREKNGKLNKRTIDTRERRAAPGGYTPAL